MFELLALLGHVPFMLQAPSVNVLQPSQVQTELRVEALPPATLRVEGVEPVSLPEPFSMEYMQAQYDPLNILGM